MENIKIRVPASSANLGPGYDVIGMALDVYNVFEVSYPHDELKIEINGLGADEISKGKSNLFYRAFCVGFNAAGVKPPVIHIKQENFIPAARGLGSSSTAILGGFMAARKILGQSMTQDMMLENAVRMEGHPDNLLPAYHGGIVISYMEGGMPHAVSFLPGGNLKIVLVIPDIKVNTSKARSLLPDKYEAKDVVYNLANISLLVHALSQGRFDLLKRAMDDKIHQPYRASLIPGFYDVIDAAVANGAYGASLSGSGSTIIALCGDNADNIATAMTEVFSKNGVKSEYMVTQISGRGAQIT